MAARKKQKTFDEVAKVEQDIRASLYADLEGAEQKDGKPKDEALLLLRSQIIGRVMDLGAYPEKTSFAEINALIHYSLAYYIVTEELDYKNVEVLDTNQTKTIIAIYKRMLAAIQGRAEDEDIGDAMLHFLENISAPNSEDIIERVKALPTDNLLYPIDKPNKELWDMAEDSAKHGGQIAINVLTAEPVDEKKPLVYLSIDFENLPLGVSITKTLTAYDKRVYIAVGALFNGGNKTVSLTQIYRMMGYEKRPNSKDLGKINDSLTKMGWARLYINNEQENEVIPKYKKMVYDAPLLAFERKTAIIDGKIVDGAIHIGIEPPMIKFARDRNQVEPVTLQMLTTPISKTERNLEIEDYLMWRIAPMGNPKRVVRNKILFETLFRECHIRTTDRMAQSRAKETISKIMEHYKKTNFIKDYTIEADGVTIEPREKPKK